MTPWDPNDGEQHIQNVLKLRYAQPVVGGGEKGVHYGG